MIQAIERVGRGAVTARISDTVGVVTAESSPVDVICLEGEFDLSNVGDIDRAIDEGIDAGARDFVADLSRVDFLDARTVHALVDGWKRAARRNGRFVVVDPPDRIWRVFVLVGASRTFPRFASRPEALAYLAQPDRLVPTGS